MISQEPSQNALLQGKWILLYGVRQQLLAQLLAIHVQGVHDTRTRLVYSLHVDKRKAIAIYHNQKKKLSMVSSDNMFTVSLILEHL